jgi:hypothetical protein
LALAWLKYFDLHAKLVGVYWLLIIDGYESHCSVDFQDLCREKKIITLCMPLHLSHLLQPLNVACFSLLKRLYGDEVSALARSCIYYINKETFLLAFKATFKKTFIAENVCAGFRGARLVPYNLEAVLLKLNVRLRTLTLLKPSDVAWELKTLRNAYEVEEQLTLI